MPKPPNQYRQYHWMLIFLGIFVSLPRLFFADTVGLARTAMAKEEPRSIEIHLTSPLAWVSECSNGNTHYYADRSKAATAEILRVEFDAKNMSPDTTFLPSRQMVIELKVNRTEARSVGGAREDWVNMYGQADMLPRDALSPLAPGAILHFSMCFWPQITVASFEMKANRQIPVRGKLRISVYYFLDAENQPQSKLPPPNNHTSKRRELAADKEEFNIPCGGDGCEGCPEPPLIANDEKASLANLSEWRARGKLIEEDLALRFPACFRIPLARN